MNIPRICFLLIVFLSLSIFPQKGRAQKNSKLILLKGKAAVDAVFEMSDISGRWIAYHDIESEHRWDISGPFFKLETVDGKQVSGEDGKFSQFENDSNGITLETDISDPPLTVKRRFSFCKDGRTLRIQTSLRSRGEPVTVKRIDLLEITISGEKLHLTGPDYVSFPIFGERIFAGIEHPSAECHVQDNTLCLSQSPYTTLGNDWFNLPAAVFGSASDQDFSIAAKEGLRHAFIRYLDSVRIKPTDMHIHYNDWWTAPQPSSEAFVLANIEELKKNLYDKTGFFFDSYALDEGWADRHSVWEINNVNFPDRFDKIKNSLARIGSRPGLWISPSSLYPNSLDNYWLKMKGYEVTPHNRLGFNACLAIGGQYQTRFKNVLEKHVRQAGLAHVKFDGFVPSCAVTTHGHPGGAESYLSIANGLIDVFDCLRQIDADIALEPTCFGYQASPWWLLHVPFIIGPFGDDSPKGRCPSPEWIEAMTTARDIKNREGRDHFLMPGPALQCFDIVVQSPGSFQNHAVMAIGRGRWFISCYINPVFMDTEEWQFFADLMTWARQNRNLLQEPIPIGGNPALRQAYGYAFHNPSKELVCVRNPWMEEATMTIPFSSQNNSPREIRSIYPKRQILARLNIKESLPPIHLGPYETKFIEIVPIDQQRVTKDINQMQKGVSVTWIPKQIPSVQAYVFDAGPEPFGLSWSCPEGDTKEIHIFNLDGEIEVKGAETSNLYILCEGLSVESAFPQLELTIDGIKKPFETSRSVGSFSAGGYVDEDWVWYTTPFPAGKHEVIVKVKTSANSANFGVFLRGTVKPSESIPAFEPGPAFPLFKQGSAMWSYTIAFRTGQEIEVKKTQSVTRPIERINGIYLDTMEWTSATVGWGKIHANSTVKGQTMTMGGQLYYRGIGTHAYSRIVYKCPKDVNTFAATIGCDQKALVGSVVFVVQGNGRELFRSPVLRADSKPIDIDVSLNSIDELVLIVEDGGDRINADHGNWANARFLKNK